MTRLGLAVALVALTGPAFAFGGCVISPENPSLILALLGGGAASLPWLRRHFRKR